jgi:hypothetical protein
MLSGLRYTTAMPAIMHSAINALLSLHGSGENYFAVEGGFNFSRCDHASSWQALTLLPADL